MPINLTSNGTSSFRITRPAFTSNGLVSDVDQTIQKELDQLDRILARKIFERVEDAEDETGFASRSGTRGGTEPAGERADQGGSEFAGSEHLFWRRRQGYPRRTVNPDPVQVLRLPLTPRRVPGDNWADNSLIQVFNSTEEEAGNISLSEYIDMTPDLAELKYKFQDTLNASRFSLDYNVRAVLDDHPAIADYLVAYAFHVLNLTDVNGVRNFVVSNKNGAKAIANYGIVSAARGIISTELLQVPAFNDDDSPFVKALEAANIPLSATSFRPLLKRKINDFVFNTDELELIEAAEQAGLGKIPDNLKPQLVRLIQRSPIKIDADNIRFFLPTFIQQILESQPVTTPPEPDIDDSGQFEVDFFEDDPEQTDISKSAVLCAAQLYYSMVTGEELGAFNVITYFTHKYLIERGIEIRDKRLRTDLQQYVFSGRFKDLDTNEIMDRTRPAERQMFYRQVFNYGVAPVTDAMVINEEFPNLWKIMILESAKYLERARESFHPDSFVSRQNVMQAVEDLQYNLSNHTIGMAPVITPQIYAELNFAIRRIFMHPEVLRQVVPTGGTWVRAVETIAAHMTRRRPRGTVLYNKAKLGHEIIRSIAEYNPTTFEDDAKFSSFISTVDAYITTQSILQDSLTDSLRRRDAEAEDDQTNGYEAPSAPPAEYEPAPQAAGAAAGSGGGASSSDEWNF